MLSWEKGCAKWYNWPYSVSHDNRAPTRGATSPRPKRSGFRPRHAILIGPGEVLKKDSVERLFFASLRRALEEIAPEKLEVFQKWFDPSDRRPQFHIAPVMGAVSYLGREPALYEKVMDRAGRYASDWSYEHLSPFERKLWSSLPLAGRERAVKRLLRAGLKNIHRDGQLEARREGSKLVVVVSNSIFCRTGTGNGPVCVYYASLFKGLMQRAALGWSLVVESNCAGQGRPECEFEVTA